MTRLKKEDVLKVANLARLALTDEEIERFSLELNKILDYVGRLSEIDTENVSPTFHPNITETPLREDDICPSIGTEASLDQAPDKMEDFFRVPRVIK